MNSFAIILFLVVFYAINIAQPAFMYNEDGSFREFGIGYKKKTVVPAWLVAIIIAIFSYLGVLYYLTYPRM
jgi:amino acid transporter